MKSILRTFGAVLAGLFVLLVLLVVVELFSAVVHPFPENFGGTPEEVCKHVEMYPSWVLAVVIPLWGIAAFFSSWTARVLGNVISAAIVQILLIAALVVNISMLPYPVWFKIACLIVMPIAGLAGLAGSWFPVRRQRANLM